MVGSLAKAGRDNYNYLYDLIAVHAPGKPVELMERNGVLCYD